MSLLSLIALAPEGLKIKTWPQMKEYTLYIDESCHLESDNFPVMCIGYTKIENSQYETQTLMLLGTNPHRI